MRLRIFWSSWFAALVMVTASAEEPPSLTPYFRSGRAFFPEHGCSLVVSKGWQKQQDGNSAVLFAHRENGSRANVILSVWETEQTPSEFAAEAAAAMAARKFKVSPPEAFTAFSKLSGMRLRADQPDDVHAGVQFVFPAGERRILTLTGTFDRKMNAEFERVLDLCIKTIHLLDRPHSLPLEVGTRFGEKRGSLRIPLGWEACADVAEAPAFAPPVIHHGEQLFLTFEASDQSLRDYVRADLAADPGPGTQLEQPEDFKTLEAGQGIKVRGIVRRAGAKDVQMATYYFEGPSGLKMIVCAATDADHWPLMEALFDSCARTARVGP